MPTYLLTCNPKRWPWAGNPEAAATTASGSQVEVRWSTDNRRSFKAGDRLCLLRQGEEPRGIVSAGSAVGPSFENDN
jgi:hypothetical protein